MGFGQGILKKPRRFTKTIPGNGTFGLVVSQHEDSGVKVITPAGTPEFMRPRAGELPVFPHEAEESLFDLVPRAGAGEVPPRRSMISDARDLLLHTLYEHTAIRRPDRTIDPTRSPLLVCENERRDSWAAAPSGPPGLMPGFIHIGRTRLAEQLLQTAAGLPAIRAEWDGRLDSLDADGYVILVFPRVLTGAVPGLLAGIWAALGLNLEETQIERHIVLAGGNDTSTYYAVADFLYNYVGARWLFPGPVGTVIPRREFLRIDHSWQLRVEEPHYRGRNLVAMADGSAALNHSAREIHDVRNWLLRNRLHPTSERAVLYVRRPIPDSNSPEHFRFFTCTSLPPHSRKYHSLESRIPVGHALSRYFSPRTPSWDAAQFGLRDTRVTSFPSMYPDPRPRILSDVLQVVMGSFPAINGQQTFFPCTSFEQRFVRCDDLGLRSSFCQCPFEEEVVTLHSGIDFNVAINLTLQPRERCAEGEAAPDAKTIAEVERLFAKALAPGDEPLGNLRFIPRSTRLTHAQDSAPSDGWAPCLFSSPPQAGGGTENPHASFRDAIALDLANQLIFLNVQRMGLWGNRNPEFCESVAADDGGRFWCECIPCRSTNSRDGSNESTLVFKGQAWLRDVREFEKGFILNNTDPAVQTLWLCQSSERFEAQKQHAARVIRRAIQELQMRGEMRLLADLGLGLFPGTGGVELDQALDALALRGLIPEAGRIHTRARRLLVLWNRMALALARAETTRDAFHGVLPSALFYPAPPAPFYPARPSAQDTLLTFMAYLDYTAPPNFESNPLQEPQRQNFYSTSGESAASVGAQGVDILHPILTPVIAGSRDLLEYDDVPGRAAQRFSSIRGAAPFVQHRMAPELFNLRRWSLIARQTGFYEWMYGRTSLVPRIYTQRFYNALKSGYEDYRARVFLAETEPHMGLDGIKFFELARMLWNLEPSPVSVRNEFCRSLCGSNAAATVRMQLYFNQLEDIWCTREVGYPNQTATGFPPPPQQRNVSGFNLGTFQGYGALGRLGWITELEPYLRGPDDRRNGRVPALGSMPFDAAWRLIDAAYQLTLREEDAEANARIQYFRRAFGLLGTLIEVYNPIWRAWALVEPFIEHPSDAADPDVWSRSTRNLASIPSEVRTRVSEILAPGRVPADWTTVDGFRRDVRNPIHRYLVGRVFGSRLGDNLGLGLGGL